VAARRAQEEAAARSAHAFEEKERQSEERRAQFERQREAEKEELRRHMAAKSEHIRSIISEMQRKEEENKALFRERERAAEDRLAVLAREKAEDDARKAREAKERQAAREEAARQAADEEEARKRALLEKQRQDEETLRKLQEEKERERELMAEAERLKREDKLFQLARQKRVAEHEKAAVQAKIAEESRQFHDALQQKERSRRQLLAAKLEQERQKAALREAVQKMRQTRKWDPPPGIDIGVDIERLKERAGQLTAHENPHHKEHQGGAPPEASETPSERSSRPGGAARAGAVPRPPRGAKPKGGAGGAPQGRRATAELSAPAAEAEEVPEEVEEEVVPGEAAPDAAPAAAPDAVGQQGESAAVVAAAAVAAAGAAAGAAAAGAPKAAGRGGSGAGRGHGGAAAPAGAMRYGPGPLGVRLELGTRNQRRPGAKKRRKEPGAPRAGPGAAALPGWAHGRDGRGAAPAAAGLAADIVDGIRRKQDEHLLSVLREEQIAESRRETVLRGVGRDERARLEQIFARERQEASQRILAMAARNQHQLSERMAQLGVAG